MSAAITTISSTTTLPLTNTLFLINASLSSITLTFPDIQANMNFTLKRIDNNSNNTVTLVGQAGETIDGNINKLLNPNTTTIFNKYGSLWYSFNTNSVGNEINLAFNQLVGSSTTRPYIIVKNNTFTAAGIFNYNGKRYYGISPTTFEITYGIDSTNNATATFTIQIQDLINKQIIATIGPITQSGSDTSYFNAYTTVISNVPDLATKLEVDAKITGNVNIRIYSVRLILN